MLFLPWSFFPILLSSELYSNNFNETELYYGILACSSEELLWNTCKALMFVSKLQTTKQVYFDTDATCSFNLINFSEKIYYISGIVWTQPNIYSRSGLHTDKKENSFEQTLTKSIKKLFYVFLILIVQS